MEFLGERSKGGLVELVERGAVDRRKREAVAEPDRLSAATQGEGGEQGDLGVAAPDNTGVTAGGDLGPKVALRRIGNEQLRLVSLSLQPLEEEVDDGAHSGAYRLRQAHDISVAGQIGERPRVEEDSLDILWRQMKDEAARSRQRVLRHARRETRRKLHERGAAGPEGEMGGGAGGGGLSRAKKGLGDARDQIDPLGRERRRKLLAGDVELRQQRALLDLGVTRAGAVSEHVGHGSVLTLSFTRRSRRCSPSAPSSGRGRQPGLLCRNGRQLQRQPSPRRPCLRSARYGRDRIAAAARQPGSRPLLRRPRAPSYAAF